MTDVPSFQLATLAATARVLIDELGLESVEAARIAVLIDGAIRTALAEFGPELTLRAAEVLWDDEDES